MAKKYLFVIKKERNDWDYDLVYLDYKVIDGTNKLKILKKAEKLLKQKNKKEEKIHSVSVEDLIDIVQIVI